MKKKFFVALLIVLAFLFVYRFYSSVSINPNDRFFSIKKIDAHVYSTLSCDFKIAWPAKTVIVNAGSGGGHGRGETSLYAKIILDQSTLSDFKKGILFKTTPAIDDDTIENLRIQNSGLVKFFPWWSFACHEIDHIDKSGNGLTMIIYLKEKSGKIIVFLLTRDAGLTGSFATPTE